MANKIRMEVRIDEGVQAKLKALASSADVSLSQLVDGVLSWAAAHGHVGRPSVEREGDRLCILEDPEGEDEVLWFGKESVLSPDGQVTVTDGVVAFILDYSAGRAVTAWPEVEDAAEEG